MTLEAARKQCEVSKKCKEFAPFWVQTRRKIPAPGNPELGVKPFVSERNLIVCGKHLQRAVRTLNKMNREAARGAYLPATDGVVVKYWDAASGIWC